jgi:hypothetical protein
MFTRVLDLAVLLLVAVAVLLPRPDVVVQPGLKLDIERRERVAELEAALGADPGEAERSLELSDLFMDGRRPDWALAAVTRALERQPHDHRLHGRRSMALAEHFEAAPAFVAAEKALALCESGSSAKCGEQERARLAFLRDTLGRVKDLDMRRDPNTAKERLLRAMKPAYLPPAKGSSAPAPEPAPVQR